MTCLPVAEIHGYGSTVIVDTDLWEEGEFNTFWTRLGRFISSADECFRFSDRLTVTSTFMIDNRGDSIFLLISGKSYLTFRSKHHEGVIAGLLPAGIPDIVGVAIRGELAPYAIDDLESEILDFIEDYLE